MDPFSIIAGTASLADVTLRVVRYLRDVQTAAAEVQDAIFRLIGEIEALTAVSRSIGNAFRAQSKVPPDPALPESRHLHALWQQMQCALADSEDLVRKLEEIVRAICGDKGPETANALDSFRKANRKRSKRDELNECREQLLTCLTRLQIVLSGIMMCNQHKSQDYLDQIMKQLELGEQQYDSRISRVEGSIYFLEEKQRDELDKAAFSSLQQLRKSLHLVAAAASTNKHFDIPQQVSSIYTGRESDLQTLREIFITSIRSPHQKRFVIHGVGGSGKTQFCSKFAQDNRDQFWGVFWIDASSDERIKQTLGQIAEIGRVKPSVTSALHWLSNLDEKWLLIIDNADDSAMHLESYFPSGDRGHILITTRNPAQKVHGNIGPGFFNFHSLECEDAHVLLLRAAYLPKPWDSDTSSWATKITTRLGFLALALTQAGAAIRSGLCTLKNYLQFYDEHWLRVRSMRSASVDSSHGLVEYESVCATYEVSFRAIEGKGTQSSQDAIQLLKTFAFLYHENIRLEMLSKAVTNKQVEENAAKDSAKSESLRAQSWREMLQDLKVSALRMILQDRAPPSLPHLIRDARSRGQVNNIRLRYAIKELHETSLVNYDWKSDSCSMHPLVHKWARERPEMRTAEQAVWAHVAATTIAHSILIPPLGGSEEDERFHRDLLPHIDHVRECLHELQHRIEENRSSSWLKWLIPQSSFNRDTAVRFAKFSIAYALGGRWRDAETLQRAVRDYTYRALGLQYSPTRRITLALAGTLWNLGRSDEAAGLQKSVLEACNQFLGHKHPETLAVMSTLAQTRWQQGRYTDARELQEEVVSSLVKAKGYEEEETLIAMDDLGRTLSKFYTGLERAKTLHLRAVDGLKKILGERHSKTLVAIESLASIEVQMNGDLDSACAMMQNVRSIREETLGKEHAYTLLAMANLARAKSAKGEQKEAEELLRSGIPIAERTLGAGHIGTLMGRTILGTILVRQRRLQEAERELLDVSELQRHISDSRGDAHPDRMGTLIQLVECYKLQSKYDDSIRYCDAAIDGLTQISVQEHPLARKMKTEKQELIRLRDADLLNIQAA